MRYVYEAAWLHLTILLENTRREGYEPAVSGLAAAEDRHGAACFGCTAGAGSSCGGQTA